MMGRLIDADLERDRIYNICKSKGNQFDKKMFSANDIMEILNSSPTAYDVDKIVSELKEDTTCRIKLEGYIPKSKAIDIVKQEINNGLE